MPSDPFISGLRVTFSTGPAAFCVVVALLAWLGLAAGWFGAPLVAIAASWSWTYWLLVLGHAARGEPPPVLSIEMTNPAHEARPLLMLLLYLPLGVAVEGLRRSLGAWPAACVVLVFLVCLPASLALLALEDRPLRALSPPAIVVVAHRLGRLYAVVVVLFVSAAFLVAGAAAFAPHLVALLVLEFVAVTGAATLGAALLARRAELGLAVTPHDARRAEAEARALARERGQAVDDAYALLRARRPEAAYARLAAALGEPPVDPEECRWFRDRAAGWGDRTVADRLTAQLVARLIALGRRGAALEEVERCWAAGGRFVALTARDLDVLKSVASAQGHAGTRERLTAEAPPAAD